MMSKPKAIQWLEEQTGQSIEFVPDAPRGHDRHLSVRLNAELAAGLDAIAAERGVSVSQLVREELTDLVRHRASMTDLDGRALADRLASDVAEVRRRLAG
jgi:predicted DNA-binding ribbon-helix-helix protein